MSALLPHRRLDPLTGRHILVSPQRALRPWQGAAEATAPPRGPAYDPDCYLCPGNVRANGTRNPAYPGVHVFPNDFPALLAESTPPADPLFAASPARGETRVICFSPDHGATLADLDPPALAAVVDAWVAQASELGRRFVSVQLFENKGAAMGCSNPHPHGQVWATDFVPDELAVEDERQHNWLATRGAPLLAQVAEREADGERVIEQTDRWLAIVPFWATWPFEALILPRFDARRLPDLAPADRTDLALLLARLLPRYDRLFGVSFPYSMGWHGAPFDGAAAAHWRLHAHLYPPLLRSATVRKFMVGFELLAEAQRDLTPEQAAERLRAA